MTQSELGGGVVLLAESLAWVAWLALAAVLAVRSRARARSPEALALLALAIGGLVLRLAAPAVQHDVNPRMDEVFGPWTALRWSYTHGLVALLRVVGLVLPKLDDQDVFHTVGVLGALVPPAVAALTLRLGGGRAAAAAAGLVLAGLGLHVRYSHTDAPQIVEGLLTVVGALALTAPTARPDRVLVPFAALSLALAATLRPEAIAVPPLVCLWAMAGGFLSSWRSVVAVLAATALVAAPDLLGVLLAGDGPSARGAGLDQGHGAVLFGVRHFVLWNSAFVPAVLGVLPLFAPLGRAGARRSIATVGLMLVLGGLVGNAIWSIGDTASWCLARHQLRVLPWMAILVGLGMEVCTDFARSALPFLRRPVVPGLGLIALVGLTRPTLRDAYAPFTLSDEYTFVRATLPTLPSDCAVVTLRLEGDRGLALPQGPAPLGLSRTWLSLDDDLSAQTCVVYYRSAQCTVAGPGESDPGDRCAAFESRWTMTPLAERAIVARGWLWEHYATPTLRVGYYRLGALKPASGSPAPAAP